MPFLQAHGPSEVALLWPSSSLTSNQVLLVSVLGMVLPSEESEHSRGEQNSASGRPSFLSGWVTWHLRCQAPAQARVPVPLQGFDVHSLLSGLPWRAASLNSFPKNALREGVAPERGQSPCLVLLQTKVIQCIATPLNS